MKNTLNYISLTALAAAMMLGGSLSANEQQPVGGNTRQMKASELIGMNVENHQGETIGTVDEVFIDVNKGEISGVLISTGGFLGMGDRKTLFGMRDLSVAPNNEKVLMDFNREQLLAFAEFKPEEKPDFENLRQRNERMGPRDGATVGRNQANADRKDGTSSELSVFDQGNSQEEINMTASIRTAIRDNEALSIRANNVTIITNKNKVVLRGEVDSASEKANVENIAHNKAGRHNVKSELTVNVR